MGQTFTSQSLEKRVTILSTICKTFSAQIFHGIFDNDVDNVLINLKIFDYHEIHRINHKDFIELLCHNLIDILENFIDNTKDVIDMNHEIELTFLKETVPVYVELFLRRKTLREHEICVSQVFMTVSRLTAQQFAQDIIELCEIRNILFTGTLQQTSRFVTVKDLRLPNVYYQQGIITMGPGFYSDYGRPNTFITPKEVSNFWADEWEKVLGETRAKGHFIQIYKEDERVWREGRVKGYNPADGTHTILLDPLVKESNDDGSPQSLSKANDELLLHRQEITIKIALTRHFWSDSLNRHRITSQISANIPSKIKKQLQMSESDVGSFLKVWWSKYQRSVYGRVVGFDPKARMHAIVYEDGEVREYEMVTKTYEVIDITDRDIARAVENVGKDNASAAKIVGRWHQRLREVLDSTSDDASIYSNDNNSVQSHIVISNNSVNKSSNSNDQVLFVLRPLASQGFGSSYHHINTINSFFSEGGSDSIFQVLSDASRPPPLGKILLLNLQFVYQLRHIANAVSFREIVWEIKEAVPFALSRYDDPQFKDLTINDIIDMFGYLKELVTLTAGNDKTTIIDQQLDELRMVLSLRLLKCSQIQKRYLGLSMIKDVIDCLAPKIAIYNAKRLQYLSSTKNGRFARDPNPNATKLAGTSPPPSKQFPATTLSMQDMLQWLVNNRIVEEIFGSSIHQDLASKSDLVLIFMAHRRVLNESHTEIIWQSCRGAHEAVVKVVHQLIMLLVPVLEPNLRMKFFAQISSVPIKEYNEALLYLIKAYTVQALLKIKDEGNVNTADGRASSNNSVNGDSSQAPRDDASVISSSDSQYGGFSLGRKGLVVSAPPRLWMGFGVLWQFIQDPIVSSFENQKSTSFIEESLFDLAIQLLVELLQSEFSEEREKVMLRCLENIRAGISVPASLQLFRKTLATYSSATKSWFNVSRTATSKIVTISSQIEKFQKHEKLLDVLFFDIDRYHKTIIEQMTKHPSNGNLVELANNTSSSNHGSNTTVNKPSGHRPYTGRKNHNNDNNPLNDTRLLMNGKISRTSHIKGVTERLDFLKFILSRSSLSLTDSQMMIVWKAFGDGAITIETFEKLIDWIDCLILRESKLFSTLLQSLALECDPLNPKQPSKLALLWQDPAVSSNLGLATDGLSDSNGEEILASAFEENVLSRLFENYMAKWVTRIDKLEFISRPSVATMCMKLFLLVNLNNRSIRVESDGIWFRMGPLSGLGVLWRLALDATDSKVSEAAITLIVELHHRTPSKFKGSMQIRSYLFRICFIQLSTAVQSLRVEDVNNSPVNGSSAPSPILRSDSGRLSASASPRRRSKTNGDKDEASFLKRSQSSRVVLEGEGYPVTFQITAPQNHHFPDTPAIAVAPGSDDWYDDGDNLVDSSVIATRITRLISLMRLFIYRFQKVPTQIYNIKILAGREENVAFTISMLSTETVGILREKVANHFKEPANLITLVKPNRSNASNNRNGLNQSQSSAVGLGAIFSSSGSTVERLDKDDVTLKQAKFQAFDSVIARKKELTVTSNNNNQVAPSTVAVDTSALNDFITPTDLSTNILNILKPIQWLQMPLSPNILPGRSQTQLTDSNMEIFTDCFFPLSRKAESNLWLSESSSFTGNILTTDAGADGSDSNDYLAQYLKKSPHHIDQLLEMLDGYLSAELLRAMNGSTSESVTTLNPNVDVSTIVWDVIQSLPVHSELLRQVKDIVNDSNGQSIRRLLDLSSPYRFLYTLQIVENLLDASRSMSTGFIGKISTSEVPAPPLSPASNSTGQSNNASALPPPPSKQITRVAFEWSVKFLFHGAAEHVIHLLTDILKFSQQTCDDFNKSVKVSKDNQDIPKLSIETNDLPSNVKSPRQDFYSTNVESSMLTITILVRILNRLLLLDPLYESWQLHQKSSTALAADALLGGNHQKVPPGIVLACIDVKSMVHLLLDYVYNLRKKVGSALSSTLQSLTEHAVSLIFGLVVAIDDGCDVLKSYPLGLSKWLKAFCLDCSYKYVRLGSCRRVFEACANLILISNDLSISAKEKKCRLSILDFIWDVIVVLIPYGGSDSKSCYHGEQLYSLTSLLTALQYSPSLIFPVEPTLRRKLSYEVKPGVISQEELPRRKLTGVEVGSRFRELYSTLTNILSNHKSSESFHSYEIDGTLVGLLRALLILAISDTSYDGNNSQLIHNNDDHSSVVHSLINELYTRCLFPSDASNFATSETINLGASCQVWESRNLAYAVLHQLCRHNESNLRVLSNIISENYSNKIRTESNNNSNGSMVSISHRYKQLRWGYNPNLLAKDSDAYVGLVNQGGTCYMNSFLQQLFHVPEFCNAILKVDVNPPDNSITTVSEDDNTGNDSDNFLFQLQVLFGYLKLSQKKFYDTLSFCKVFKDYDGQPISLIEQKDINEFAGMLFDKLESNLNCKSALGSIIQGKVVYKTKSLESSYRSEREESFYMITAEVKGKSSLLESLDLLVAEELFSGDNKIEDEEAGRKVDAIRRCAVRDLPNTLIIHLKRFEFDLETMDRKKVNDHITFPMELDMYPYTEEGISSREKRMLANEESDIALINGRDNHGNAFNEIDGIESSISEDSTSKIKNQAALSHNRPENYYRYNLIGIVAHVGAIDRGHYYSFIKERHTQKWYEFNDRNVFPFSPEAIPNECFGGEEVVTTPQGGQVTRMKQNNAYLLLYERVSSTYEESEVVASGKNSSDTEDKKSSANPPVAVSDENDIAIIDSKESESPKTSPSTRTNKDVKVSKDPSKVLSRKDSFNKGFKVVKDVPSRGINKSPSREAIRPQLKEISRSSSKAITTKSKQLTVNTDSNQSERRRTSKSLTHPNLSTSSNPKSPTDASTPSSPASSSTSLNEIIPTSEASHSPIITPADTPLDTPSAAATSMYSNEWRLSDMSKRVLQAVWSENTEFQTDRYLYSIFHFRFMWQLLISPAFTTMLTMASNRDGKLVPVVASVMSSDYSEVHVKAEIVEKVSPMSSDTNRSDDTSLQSPSSSLPDASPTLELMTLLAIKFTLEVVSTARAMSCLPMFFDRIFEIINIDSTGKCASAILSELSKSGRSRTMGQHYYDPHPQIAEGKRRGPVRGDSVRGSTNGTPRSSIAKKSSQDIQFINENVHPWLILVYVYCPIVPVVRAFSKLILSCIKKVRSSQARTYYNILIDTSSIPINASISNGQNANEDTNTSIFDDPSHSMDMYENQAAYITTLINKLLIISERIPIEDAIGRDGFHMVGGLLYHVALLGYEERAIMIKLQTVFRMVCALLSLNSTASKLSHEDLTYSIDTICLLVRSTAIKKGESKDENVSFEYVIKSRAIDSMAIKQYQSSKRLEQLQATDIQAFMNRVFLDDALAISSSNMSEAIIHVCFCRGNKELVRTMEFLMERIEECVLSTRGTTSLAYKNYLKVVADLLMSSKDNLMPVFDTVASNILNKAEVAASRHGPTDAEFVYSILKFFHQVGTSSDIGFQMSMKYKESWRKVRVRFTIVKRVGPPPVQSSNNNGANMLSMLQSTGYNENSNSSGNNSSSGNGRTDDLETNMIANYRLDDI